MRVANRYGILLYEFSIIMEFADNGDLYQKIVERTESNELFSE
jgi:hypothetical protein